MRTAIEREGNASVEYDEDPDRAEMLELEEILGQTYHLLASAGDEQASMLMLDVDHLRLEVDGYYRDPADPIWPTTDYAAVLEVETFLVPRFTEEVHERIWTRLQYVLRRHNKTAERMRVEETLPQVGPDWRASATRDLTADRVTNQARRERQDPEHPTYEGLTFGSLAEIEVYKMLVDLQRSVPVDRAFAIMPLPTVQLQRMGLRSPDLVVVGNGRALVIEVDGPHHRAAAGPPTSRTGSEPRVTGSGGPPTGYSLLGYHHSS